MKAEQTAGWSGSRGVRQAETRVPALEEVRQAPVCRLSAYKRVVPNATSSATNISFIFKALCMVVQLSSGSLSLHPLPESFDPALLPAGVTRDTAGAQPSSCRDGSRPNGTSLTSGSGLLALPYLVIYSYPNG